MHHFSGSEVHHDRSLPASASWSVVSHSEASVEPLSCEQKRNLSDLVSHTGARVVDAISHLKLPWEHGLYKAIFESDPLTTSLSVPPLHVQDGSAGPSVDFSAARASRPQPVARSLQAFKQHLDISYEDRVAKLAEVSIGKLVAFVEALPESCKPESWPAAYEECVSYLQACVGVKSPLTIEKRANSLLQYLRWAAKEGVCANIFSEEIFWTYVQHLKHTHVPVSRGPAVASALRFASHVLGVASHRNVLSRRCLGLLEQMEAAKGPLRQASPLTVEDLLMLHGVLRTEGKAAWDRAAAAYLLVCAYGRARAGDFSRVARVSSDLEGPEGFLEILLKTHKGAKKAKLKSQLVPVLIPSIGVDGAPWVPLAIAAFEAVGLSLDGPVDGALFRPPTSPEGVPGRREVRSAEVSSLLHSMLGDSASGRTVSSHSLKATCLSWVGKYGVSPECQNILGRHSDSVRGSAPLYNRDLCAAPVRQLQRIIMAIHQAKFCPDSSRSMYFPSKVLPAQVIEVKDEQPERVEDVSVAGEPPDGSPAASAASRSDRRPRTSDVSSGSESCSSSSSSNESSTSGTESEDCETPQRRAAKVSWPSDA